MQSPVPDFREKTSGEETPPQTQPEAQVRVPGNPRERDLRQGEESPGEVRQAGELEALRALLFSGVVSETCRRCFPCLVDHPCCVLFTSAAA